MTSVRIALANIALPPSPEASLALALAAVDEAAAAGALVVAFPECYVPGYRVEKSARLAVDMAFMEEAWSTLAAQAARRRIGVVLGTERTDLKGRYLSALVIDRDGRRLGFQDKVQLAPTEDSLYTAGTGRRLFQIGPLKLGVVICHEGWRYPETVRAAARLGAHVVFHPHADEDVPGRYPPGFADPANTFHEKAMLCRAAENTCYFASINCAGAGSATTSAVADPEGRVLAWQPYGQAGILAVDIDLAAATGRLAARVRPAG